MQAVSECPRVLGYLLVTSEPSSSPTDENSSASYLLILQDLLLAPGVCEEDLCDDSGHHTERNSEEESV